MFLNLVVTIMQKSGDCVQAVGSGLRYMCIKPRVQAMGTQYTLCVNLTRRPAQEILYFYVKNGFNSIEHLVQFSLVVYLNM